VFRQVDPVALRAKLDSLWKAAIAGVAKEIGSTGAYTSAATPEVQTALDGWLRILHQEGITGVGPWDGVELIHDEDKRQYGYLNVVRTDGPAQPGVGIAAWLAEGAARRNELKVRLTFFDANPRPIRTLVLLRRDGTDALAGATGDLHTEAVAAGRDIRVVRFEPRHVHALFALDRWRQSARPELEAQGSEGRLIYREVLAGLSSELLGWVDQWRTPAGRDR
jgi:hypothetical protein